MTDAPDECHGATPAALRLDDQLGPLPEGRRFKSQAGVWCTADQMRAERERCYALGLAAEGCFALMLVAERERHSARLRAVEDDAALWEERARHLGWREPGPNVRVKRETTE